MFISHHATKTINFSKLDQGFNVQIKLGETIKVIYYFILHITITVHWTFTINICHAYEWIIYCFKIRENIIFLILCSHVTHTKNAVICLPAHKSININLDTMSYWQFIYSGDSITSLCWSPVISMNEWRLCTQWNSSADKCTSD